MKRAETVLQSGMPHVEITYALVKTPKGKAVLPVAWRTAEAVTLTQRGGPPLTLRLDGSEGPRGYRLIRIGAGVPVGTGPAPTAADLAAETRAYAAEAERELQPLGENLNNSGGERPAPAASATSTRYLQVTLPVTPEVLASREIGRRAQLQSRGRGWLSGAGPLVWSSG